MSTAKKVRWMGASVGLLAVVGYAAVLNGESCIEKVYTGGRLVECESTSMFLPAMDGPLEKHDSSDTVSSMLPPTIRGALESMGHANCKTTEIPDGHWTVCNDGFSLLERETAPVAWVLNRNAKEHQLARRTAEAERRETALRIEDTDCGTYLCSEYAANEPDAKRDAYFYSLSDRETRRLQTLIDVWTDQELDRALEKARAENLPLQKRLREMEAHEAELRRVGALAQADPESH
jgi:hypothetical protein